MRHFAGSMHWKAACVMGLVNMAAMCSVPRPLHQVNEIFWSAPCYLAKWLYSKWCHPCVRASVSNITVKHRKPSWHWTTPPHLQCIHHKRLISCQLAPCTDICTHSYDMTCNMNSIAFCSFHNPVCEAIYRLLLYKWGCMVINGWSQWPLRPFGSH